MADPHSIFAKTKHLHGKIVENNLRFDCGFRIPRGQAEFIVGHELNDGDQIQFDIVNTDYLPHKHEFKCACGKAQNENSNH